MTQYDFFCSRLLYGTGVILCLCHMTLSAGASAGEEQGDVR